MHTGLLHLLFWLVPLLVVCLVLLSVGYATVSAEVRHRRYLAGGIDLVDSMTQEQFGQYLMSYFEASGHTVSLVSQDEAAGTRFITSIDDERRFIFAKRARNGVPDAEVAHALDSARATTIRDILIVTNSVLFRNMDGQVKAQGVKVWDREKLISYMGKAGARKFALQAIECHPL
jgi:HJR/Mrr/RecB family endonuclease